MTASVATVVSGFGGPPDGGLGDRGHRPGVGDSCPARAARRGVEHRDPPVPVGAVGQQQRGVAVVDNRDQHGRGGGFDQPGRQAGYVREVAYHGGELPVVVVAADELRLVRGQQVRVEQRV
jgi:hypothetical protein